MLRTDSIASQFQLIDAKQWIHRLSIPEAGGDAVICILAVTLQATSAWWIMEGQRYIVGLSDRCVWLVVLTELCLFLGIVS